MGAGEGGVKMCTDVYLSYKIHNTLKLKIK